MSVISLLLFAAASHGNQVDPSLWLTAKGAIVNSAQYPARFSAGVSTTTGPRNMTGWRFDGNISGISFPDLPDLQKAKSLTVSLWVYLQNRPSYAGQLVFRGDDQNGADPFSLVVHQDGTLHFGITDDHGQTEQVETSLPERQWVHVYANIDDGSGMLTLRINNSIAARMKTRIRPTGKLSPNWAAGISIGNVQNSPYGPHNQPFTGTLSDVRVYARTVSPEAAGYFPLVSPMLHREG